ncbi:MAG: TonB-dependent receptor [Bacteroidota bacterium]|nr:TonB-dependent receptor [Bacteroidota bacterium]MDX5431219.1 TonB-dependent receptor [Bacteroidota bacterium]MDX5469958.1 TonB-dependent receptor [Bacteroidota bacterium]
MKFFLCFVGIWVLSVSSWAQTIRVIDQNTLQAIPKVLIVNTALSKSVQTDFNGMANLDEFSSQDTFHFSHVGYYSETFSREDLKTLNYVVALQEKSLALGEAVVSASRFEEKSEDVAQAVQVISNKALKFMNQPTTADVLQNSGGILVQKSQLGGGSPIIRGFEANKVLIVVDGVRLNNAIFRGGHLQNVITLDNAILDRVEIVYGPGSVVYGSDALGGVMHFYTMSPAMPNTEKVKVKAHAFTRFASASNEKTGHADFSIANNKWGSLSSFTFSQFGDLMQGNNRNPFYGDWGKRSFYVNRINGVDSMLTNKNPNLQVGSGYQQIDLLQKFVFRPNASQKHTLNFQYSTSSDVPRYDRLTQVRNGKARYAEWYYGPQQRLMLAYLGEWKNKTLLYDQMQMNIAFQDVEESRNTRAFQSFIRESRIENVAMLSSTLDMMKKWKDQEFRYGLDFWFNDVQSTGLGTHIESGLQTIIDSRYPGGGSQMLSAAAYVTHAWEINDKLVLNDGIRFNWVQLKAKFTDNPVFTLPFKDTEQQHEAVNGNIGLIYRPNAKWRLAGSLSTGFRAPNVDDLSKVFESVPGNLIIPNSQLNPEYTYNADLGIHLYFGKHILVGAQVYHTWYRQAITLAAATYNGQDSIFYDGAMSRVVSSTNAGRAFIYGGQFYLNADITNAFSIVSTVNYTYGRILTDSTPYPLDHIPPIFGMTNFQLKINKFRAEYVLMYSGAKRSADYNLLGEDNASNSADPVNGYMPAWLCMSVRTAWQMHQNLQLQLALENVLDQNYRVFASNISAPGRNLVVTLRGNF